MLGIGPVKIAGQSETRCSHGRESMLLTWVLYGVVRASQALAGEQTSHTDSALKDGAKNSLDTQTGTSMFSAPFAFAKPLADVEAYSQTEFRPRTRSLDKLDAARSEGSIIDAPMLKNTSVWQQLAQYRSQDRVRLLTLWQTKGSSLSLQAGKRGAPSLQWSTPWVHHEGASRGLLDRLLTSRPRLGGSNSRGNVPHPTITQAPAKPLD
ncbi:MAG: hypothetical protein M3N91_19145 [Pseudomonadota bacterium]|nr:hypothetical protein [Pseudomonadota bacterium]